MRTLMHIIRVAIYGFFYAILASGIIVYVMAYFSKVEPPSFELAVISAVLGGFALSQGFLEQASSSLQRHIRRIGVLYLGAAIAFTVLCVVIPMVKTQSEGAACWIVSVAYLISMFAAMLFFASATALFIVELPKMLQEFFCKN